MKTGLSRIWPSLRSAKNVKKQQEVSDLNQDYAWANVELLLERFSGLQI